MKEAAGDLNKEFEGRDNFYLMESTGGPVWASIDTGAGCATASRELLESLGCKITRMEKPLTLSLADDTRIVCTEHAKLEYRDQGLRASHC